MLWVFHCKDKCAHRQHQVPLIIDSSSLSLRVGEFLGRPLQLPGSLILNISTVDDRVLPAFTWLLVYQTSHQRKTGRNGPGHSVSFPER